MTILKRLFLGLLTPLLPLLIFTTAFDVGFVNTVTHPQTVKKLISESGIYDSVVPSALDQAKQITTNAGDISATDPIIQKAATTTITPQFIQKNTESAIDSVYRWLDGKTPTPEFKVDLTDVRANFVDNVTNAAKGRLSTLPVCQTAEESANTNPLNATCLPPGVTADSAAQQLKDNLSSGQGFLDQTVLSANDIKNGQSNQSVFNDQLKQAPKQYQLAKKTPTILLILTILVAAGIVFLSSSWQKGLKHIGITFAVIGIVMMVFAYALNRVVNTNVIPKIQIKNPVMQTDIRNLVSDLTQQVDRNYWLFGIGYTIVGAASFAAGEISMRRKPGSTGAESQKPPESLVEQKKSTKD